VDIAAFDRLEKLAKEPAAIERSVEYVTRQLRLFTQKGTRILICFPNKPGSLGEILHKAVLEVEAVPVHWGEDPRWLTLIRTAFQNKINAVIGSPLVVLGLNKLSKITRTPLYIRHAITAGHPSFDWLTDGIVRGLDCQTWGYFNPGGTAILCGQSCGESRGVHVRQEEYDIEIVDEQGNVLPDGEVGEICISPKVQPDLRVRTYDRARIDRTPCPCGRPTPRLMDFVEGRDCDQEILMMAAELHRWDSVLDAKLRRGDYGLELEVVVFPGFELPPLPNCARQVVRKWNPEEDVPFWIEPLWKSPVESTEND
jgi:phenylacetate-coenzyme A ligase PaaK-like adenylate-forming protein